MPDDVTNTADERAAAKKRKQLYVKLFTFAVIIVIALLRPKVEAWLAGRNAADGGQADVAVNDRPGAPTDAFDGRSGDLGTLTITEAKQASDKQTGASAASKKSTGSSPKSLQTTAPGGTTSAKLESSRTSATEQVTKSTPSTKPAPKKTSTAKTSPGKSTKSSTKVATSGSPKKTSPLPRMAQPPPLGTSSKATGKNTRSNPDKNASSKKTQTPQKKPAAEDDDVPGKLTLVRGTRDEFKSSAGLMYVRGSEDGHRLKHVLKHAEDNLSKPVHGVFAGSRDEILAWIDRAYIKGRKGGRGTRVEDQGGRTVFTVDLGEKIGFVGGQVGKRKGHPACRFLRLVIQNGSDVVTAYPAQSL